MSKDRNIDDADLAKISGAGGEKDLASADDTGSGGTHPNLKPSPTGIGSGDDDGGATSGGGGDNQDLTD